MPERISRNRSSAVAIGREPSFSVGRLLAPVLRFVMRRPADTIGGLLAAALVVATLVNALFLQASKHPAPLMAPVALALPVQQAAVTQETTGSLVPSLPRPRPAAIQASGSDAGDTKRPRAQMITDIQHELARRGFYDGTIDGVHGPKMEAAIREFEQAAKLRPSGEASEILWNVLQRSTVKADRSKSAPPARKPDAAPTSRRVSAVQRALTDFGYGQLRPSGVVDEPTKQALESFERQRKLPVKGQLSDRTLRELSSVTGRTFTE